MICVMILYTHPIFNKWNKVFKNGINVIFLQLLKELWFM